jgi:hypothetical protein
MCPEVKIYKGKEMGTFLGTQRGQKACLERHSLSEGKVKKVLCNISGPKFEAWPHSPKAFILGSS